ncbi:efflux RND transporter periplasmic adaptor subunit [Marinilabiliaceae bacterium ANBcel2]|nr:efflux RND transporter periplasmic adaptor subunit [Marinilabiliaceae bacterium ANBcel2]
MKRFFKLLGILFVLFLVVWLFVYLYNQSKTELVQFETETPFETDIVNKTVATGSVVPRREIEIKPQEDGIIREIYVDAGDSIKEGEPMARIQIIPEMIEVNAAENRLNKAQLEFENAKRDYERSKELFKSDVISQSDFEGDELRFKSAREDLKTAENHLHLIQEGVTKQMGAQTNTIIRSTIDGMILDVPVREGNSVIRSSPYNAGTTIAVIADMTEMVFEGQVDETEVGRIHEGMHLVLTIGALEGGKPFDAWLEYISPKGVEESGAIQFEIRADVTLQDQVFVRAGYSANADIVLDRRDNVLAIPERVLQFEGDKVFVEVKKEDEKFERREIKVGLSDGINIEIVEGVLPEDEIKVPYL